MQQRILFIYYVQHKTCAVISDSRMGCPFTHQVTCLSKENKTPKQTMNWMYYGLRLKCSEKQNLCVVYKRLQIFYHWIPYSTIYHLTWLAFKKRSEIFNSYSCGWTGIPEYVSHNRNILGLFLTFTYFPEKYTKAVNGPLGKYDHRHHVSSNIQKSHSF